MKNSRIAIRALLLASLVAGACSPLAPIPDRSRFFTLTAPTAEADGETSENAAPVVYGLGPIVLPAYLDRNQVATRLSPTEVAYSQWDRWAEPLGTNISSVMRQQLASELGTDAIVTYPWSGGVGVEYQIEVRLLRFESDTTGASYLIARWNIRDVQRDRKLVAKETSLTRPGKPNDTRANTAALSGMLSELGHEIAGAARKLPPPGPQAEPQGRRK